VEAMGGLTADHETESLPDQLTVVQREEDVDNGRQVQNGGFDGDGDLYDCPRSSLWSAGAPQSLSLPMSSLKWQPCI